MGCSHKDVRAWLVSPVSRRDTCPRPRAPKAGPAASAPRASSTCRSSTRAAVSQAYQIGAEPRGGEALGKRLKLSGLVHPSAWRMVRTWGAVNIASPPVGNVSCPARCHHINRQHLSALHPGRPGPRRAPRRQATEALTIHVSDRSAAPPQMPPPICLAARLETRLGCVFFSFFASARHITPDYVHAPLGYTANPDASVMLRNIAAAKMRPRQQAVVPGWTWRLTETACFRQPRGARLPPWTTSARGQRAETVGQAPLSGTLYMGRSRHQTMKKETRGKETSQGSWRGRARHRGHVRGHPSREESLMSVERIRSKQPRDSPQGTAKRLAPGD